MNYRIVIENDVLHVTATIGLEEVDQLREALAFCMEALDALQDEPDANAELIQAWHSEGTKQ